ncbi:MAG: ParA family protein [Deltaproteobacteria bacterium]
MKATAIVSQKGGVGKTTVSLNLGYALASRGWRTLIVDTDPQGGIARSLMGSKREVTGLAGYVANGTPLEQVVLATRMPELTLLPCGRIAIADTHAFGGHLADGRVLRGLVDAASTDFDVVLFDTPSGFGGSTMGAVRASDFVLCVLQAEPLAVRSLPQVFEVIGDLREEGTNARLTGILLTMLQPRAKRSLDVAAEVYARLPGDLVLETTIPRDNEFLDASGAGVPMQLLRRRPVPGARVFENLAHEVEQRLGLTPDRGDDDEPVSLFA